MSEEANPALIRELQRNNELLSERNRLLTDWRIAARNGLIAGFAGAVGATLLVSIVLAVLKPLEKIEALKPALERISQEMQRGKSK